MSDEMSETLERSRNVVGHAERESTSRPVVIDGEAEILVALPVDGELIELRQGGDEILHIVLVRVLDPEIVHD